MTISNTGLKPVMSVRERASNGMVILYADCGMLCRLDGKE
jgi:hypothetical protein